MLGCMTTVLHKAWEGNLAEQLISRSLTSPETGLSLCRQTAGCGIALIDSLLLFFRLCVPREK